MSFLPLQHQLVQLRVHFKKGSVGSIVNITSEEELIKSLVDHKMTVINLRTGLLLNFLAYTDALKVVRVESGVTNATASGAGLLIRDDDHYDNDFDNGQVHLLENGLQELLVHMEMQSVFQFVQVQLHTNKLL